MGYWGKFRKKGPIFSTTKKNMIFLGIPAMSMSAKCSSTFCSILQCSSIWIDAAIQPTLASKDSTNKISQTKNTQDLILAQLTLIMQNYQRQRCLHFVSRNFKLGFWFTPPGELDNLLKLTFEALWHWTTFEKEPSDKKITFHMNPATTQLSLSNFCKPLSSHQNLTWGWESQQEQIYST